MRDERMSRDWTPERVVEELALRGVRVRVDYYRQIEAGPKHPGKGFWAALVAIYGTAPQPLPGPVTEDVSLSAAILELVDAIRGQTEALMMREASRDQMMRDLARVLDYMRAAQRSEASSGVPVPAEL